MATKDSSEKPVVHCRRVDQDKTPEEHVTCPYCFGKLADIAPEEHAKFCSFDPAVDPIVFGFPPGTTRSR